MSSISYKPSYQHHQYPLTINHVAVSVLDLDKAVKWYTEVLGFNLVKPPIEGIADDSYLGKLFQDIFGKRFKKLKLAHLSFGNQVGLEVFEFIDPKEEKRQNNFEYWKTGFFHICLTDPNIEELTRRIVDHGGKQRSKIWELTPEKPFKVVSCEDPFGNIIDIYTHSYEFIWRSEEYQSRN